MAQLVAFDRPAAERIARVVRAVERDPELLSRTPRTPPQYDTEGNTVGVQNDTGVAVPRGGVIWLNMPIAGRAGMYQAQQPEYPGINRFGIADAEIADGEPGRAYIFGVRTVRVTGHAALVVGDRIGADFDSWDAKADELGPMIVIAKNDSPYVEARITHERGDCMYIRTDDGSVYGPYFTFVLDPSFTLSSPALGIARLGVTPT